MGGRGSASGVSGGKFKENFGSYDLDTKSGGGHIDTIVGPNLQYGLRTSSDKAYEAQSWDSKYNIGQSKVFSTLGAAKSYILDEIKKKKKK